MQEVSGSIPLGSTNFLDNREIRSVLRPFWCLSGSTNSQQK
jgi:hypothetical protein